VLYVDRLNKLGISMERLQIRRNEMNYDPYNGQQQRFERTDLTGRHSPIYEKKIVEPAWMAVLGGVFMGACLAVMLYWGLT